MSDLRYATPPPEAVASSSSLSRTASPPHAAAASSSIPRAVRSASREADEQDGSSRSSTGWARKRARHEADEDIDVPVEKSHRECLDRARSYLEQAQERDDELRQSYAEHVIRKSRATRDLATQASDFVEVFDFDAADVPFNERESWKLARRMRMPAELDAGSVKLRKESLRWARSALLIKEDAESYYRAAAAFKALAEPAKALSALERARRFDDGAWTSAIEHLAVRCSSRSVAVLLPVELFMPIFGELGTAACARALRVCRAWHSILSRPEFWRRLIFDSTVKGRRSMHRKDIERIALRSGHSITELRASSPIFKQDDAVCSALARSALSIRAIAVSTNDAACDFLRVAETCPNLSSLVIRETSHEPSRSRLAFDPSQGPLVKRGLTRVDLDLDGASCVGRFNEGLMQLIEDASFVCLRSHRSDEWGSSPRIEFWHQEQLCTISWILAALHRCRRVESFAIKTHLPCSIVPSLIAGVTHAPHLRHLSIKKSVGDYHDEYMPPQEQHGALFAPLLESLECDANMLSLLAPVSLSKPVNLALEVKFFEHLEPVTRGDHIMNLSLASDEGDLGLFIQSMLDDPSYCRNARVLHVLAHRAEQWPDFVRLVAARLYGSQPGATLEQYLAIGRSSAQAPPSREATQSGPFHRGSRPAVGVPANALPPQNIPLAMDSNLPPLCSAIKRFSIRIWPDEHVPEAPIRWLRANTNFEMEHVKRYGATSANRQL